MALASAYVGQRLRPPGPVPDHVRRPARAGRTRGSPTRSFERLIAAAERARQAGRFRAEVDSGSAATRMWSMPHGLVMLALTGALPPTAVAEHLPEMSHALFVGLGDEPEAARASITAGWLRGLSASWAGAGASRLAGRAGRARSAACSWWSCRGRGAPAHGRAARRPSP